MYVVAGPNGAGKSTLTSRARDVFGVDPIDADAIQRTEGLDDRAAWAEGLKRCREAIGENRTFLIETTLAGSNERRKPTYLTLMQEARKRGYRVDLTFVALENADTHVARVADRVAALGHDIPEDAIRRRYKFSLQRLPAALNTAHHGLLIDNSSVQQPFRQVLEVEAGRLIALSRNVPRWVQHALGFALHRLVADDCETVIGRAFDIARERGLEFRRTSVAESGTVEGELAVLGAVHGAVIDDAGIWHFIRKLPARFEIAVGDRFRGYVERGELRHVDTIAPAPKRDRGEILLETIVRQAAKNSATQVVLHFTSDDKGCVAYQRLKSGLLLLDDAYPGIDLARALTEHTRRNREADASKPHDFNGEIALSNESRAVIVFSYCNGWGAMIRLERDMSAHDELDVAVALRERVHEDARIRLADYENDDVRYALDEELNRLGAEQLARFDLREYAVARDLEYHDR